MSNFKIKISNTLWLNLMRMNPMIENFWATL